MTRNATSTILVITPQQWLRADFAGNRLLGSPESLPASPGTGWLDAARVLIQRPGPVGRSVTILDSTLAVHLISFGSTSVAPMNEEELANALRFEVETLSGIEIDDIFLSKVAAQSTNSGESRFWVSVVRNSEFRAAVDLIRPLGVRSLEIAHTAGFGFPGPAKDTKAADDHAELWGSTAFRFERHSGRLIEFYRVPSGVTEGRMARFDTGWPIQTETADAGAPNVEHDLRVESEREEWLLQVQKNVVSNQIDLPRLRQKRKSYSLDLRPMVAAVMVLIALAGCLFHHQWLSAKNLQLATQIESLAVPGAQKKRDDAEIKRLLEQRDLLETESYRISNELKRVQFFHDNQRDRLERLLGLLSELRVSDLVVNDFLHDPKGMIIGGISLNSEAAPNLANRLKVLAAPMGWRVSAATQEGQQKLISGGPWTFQILLEDVGPFEAPPTDVSSLVTPAIRPKN